MSYTNAASQSSATGVGRSQKWFKRGRRITAKLTFTAAVHHSIVCGMKHARELNGSSEQNTDREMRSMGTEDDGLVMLMAQEDLLAAQLWQWLENQG